MSTAMLYGIGGSAKKEGLNLKPNFADNTWEDIAEACDRHEVPNSWKVGDSKAMMVNGVSHTMLIIGINHDDLADGTGKASITFLSKMSLRTKADGSKLQYATTSIKYDYWWGNSLLRDSINTYLDTFPSEIKDRIKLVKKPSTVVDGGSNWLGAYSNDKLFLLSAQEMLGNGFMVNSGNSSWAALSFAYEGTQYEIFQKSKHYLKDWKNINNRSYEGYGKQYGTIYIGSKSNTMFESDAPFPTNNSYSYIENYCGFNREVSRLFSKAGLTRSFYYSGASLAPTGICKHTGYGQLRGSPEYNILYGEVYSSSNNFNLAFCL